LADSGLGLLELVLSEFVRSFTEAMSKLIKAFESKSDWNSHFDAESLSKLRSEVEQVSKVQQMGIGTALQQFAVQDATQTADIASLASKQDCD
jgi:hypothetical protein